MEQENIENLIWGYLSGELTATEELELSRWLATSEENRKLFAGFADQWAIAHVPYFNTQSKSDFEKLKSKIQKTETPPKRKAVRLFLSLRKIAVAAVVVLAMSSLSFYAGYSYIQKQDKVVSFETVVPFGSRSKVILPDQSVVWVNAGSSLQYNEDFSKKSREVFLKGEAYFEVTPDSLMPFIVKSDKLDVKVLGTTFNVRTYEEEDQVDVILRTGKVDVSMNGPASGRQTYHLLPNEKLSYNKRTTALDKIRVNADDYCVWINGGMKFVSVPFSQLISELERKYNIKLIVNSPSLLQSVYSGTFKAEQTVEDILEEIDIERKYEWKQSGNTYTICDR